MLGCSQRALRDAAQRQLGGRCDVLVRESGGGAVLAGPWLVSASVVLPLGHPWLAGGLLESYRRLGQLHVAALQACGIAAQALPPQELSHPPTAGTDASVDWACFGGLSPWEVVAAEGRKLVGLAQRRRQTGVLLVAGTLVGAVDWPLLCEAMGRVQDVAILRQATVSCADLMAPPLAPKRFAAVLAQGLERSLF